MNAIARIDAVISAMPTPWKGFGTSAMSSSSRIPAMMEIASVNPNPPPIE